MIVPMIILMMMGCRSPTVTGMWRERVSPPRGFTVRLEMPALTYEQYGSPHELWLTVGITNDGTVQIDLQAFNKTQTRLGEASFARFRPLQHAGFRWLMDKLGVVPWECTLLADSHLSCPATLRRKIAEGATV